jgi:hypothetical protein
MKVSVSRIALVTVGLAGVGAACGALLGGLTVLVQLYGIVPPRAYPFIFLRFGAVAGGYLGAIFAPTIGWLFLRRAPLYRAIGQTAVGTLIGIAIGAAIQPHWCAAYALGGFLVATGRLWFATRASASRHLEPAI